MNLRRGQSFVESGIGIMVVAIVFVGMAIPVANGVLVTDTQQVNSDLINSTGSTPDVFTLSNVEDGIKQDSETIVLEDETDSSTYTLTDSQYTIDYETGEVNVTVADLDSDGTDEIDSVNDQYQNSYEYKPDGYLGGTTGSVVDYIPLALALVLFVTAIGLVRG